jgi:hypothetical protein
MAIEQSIYNVLIQEGFSDKVARIVVAQSKYESQNYASNLFIRNNNAFGYKYVGQSIATKGIPAPSKEGNIAYANYTKIEDSALEIAKWLKRRIAEKRFTISDLETPEGYARSLKLAGYFGDNVDVYTRGIKQYLSPSISSSSTPTPSPTPTAPQQQKKSNVVTVPPKEEKYTPSKLDLSNYGANYAIITSDRLIMNAKEDSIIVAAKKTIGFSAVEQIHFNVGPLGKRDANNHFLIINSPRIQLGLPKDGSSEFVAKAESVIEYIKKITEVLQNFCIQVKTANAVGVGVSSIPVITAAADKMLNELNNVKSKYTSENSPIKSKVTKTI